MSRIYMVIFYIFCRCQRYSSTMKTLIFLSNPSHFSKYRHVVNPPYFCPVHFRYYYICTQL
jgi:hypothetical protein